MPHSPTILQPSKLPQSIRDRTRAAEALGLSRRETSHALCIPRRDKSRRLKRMKRIVCGASDEMIAAFQRQGRRPRQIMITTTYAPGEAWHPRDISRLTQRIRDWLGRRGEPLRCVWVMELTRRGVPHYHLLVWIRHGIQLPKPDQAGWWTKGHTRIETARRPTGYLAKYASKGTGPGQDFPHGARIYGVGGPPVPLGWYRAPGWMREIASPGMRIRRLTGGWLAVDDLAHAWRAPWAYIHADEEGVHLQWTGWGPGDVRPIVEVERPL